MKEEITLDQFVKIITDDVQKFKTMWDKGLKENSDCYPKSLREGDWFDQFLIFTSTTTKKHGKEI